MNPLKSKESKTALSKKTANLIFHQAMRVFLEKGYHGTTIDDITKGAGLTKGALYWHFESKEDLLKKIIGEFENRFLDGLMNAVEQVKGNTVEKLEKYFNYNAAFSYYNRELCVSFTTLSGELVGAHHAIEPEIRRIYKKYQNFLKNLILRGKKEQVFKKEVNPELAALTLIAFHDGVLLQWSMNRDKIDGKAYVQTFKKIILKGLMV